MSELRLILLVIGVLIIAGVFLLSRRPSKDATNSETDTAVRERTEPVLPSSMEALENFLATNEPQVSSENAADNNADPSQKIIILNILPLGKSGFDGRHLLEALVKEGLEYGEYGIFHYASKVREELNLFSVANILEPGSFNLETLPSTDIIGLVVFTVLPVKGLQSGDVFAEMLAVARRIAVGLGGEVTDESRSTLTRQTAHHLRESIVAFDAQLGRSQ